MGKGAYGDRLALPCRRLILNLTTKTLVVEALQITFFVTMARNWCRRYLTVRLCHPPPPVIPCLSPLHRKFRFEKQTKKHASVPTQSTSRVRCALQSLSRPHHKSLRDSGSTRCLACMPQTRPANPLPYLVRSAWGLGKLEIHRCESKRGRSLASANNVFQNRVACSLKRGRISLSSRITPPSLLLASSCACSSRVSSLRRLPSSPSRVASARSDCLASNALTTRVD